MKKLATRRTAQGRSSRSVCNPLKPTELLHLQRGWVAGDSFLLVENPLIPFIPEHPRDENDSGLKASMFSFGEQLSGWRPPIGEAEGSASGGQMLPVLTQHHRVPKFRSKRQLINNGACLINKRLGHDECCGQREMLSYGYHHTPYSLFL